ncbi:zf-HC2 domain-containing protein [Lysinibacillus sp. NPDC097287]|uniref:zf-HC2 domain-containing protein n=1 Tax=Lysinibacillus sp. NPDC097287 TaxID=3364144 RepID=UPI00382637A9
MNKITCNIIKDILPLYYDDVCSEDSKKMIEEHLVGCDGCKSELASIQKDFEMPQVEQTKNRADGNVIKNIATFWNRSKVKAFLKGTILTAIACSLIFGSYYGLFEWNITSIPSSKVEITNVSQLANGDIAYHVDIKDDYYLRHLKYDMDEDGNFYLIPLRPIIKEKSQVPHPLRGYDYFNFEMNEINHGKDIKALYYGTPKDSILIWKEGMDLPKASKEIEKMFDFE